jgi:hypothetical protein
LNPGLQQWNGSSSTYGFIYRYGNVGIGTSIDTPLSKFAIHAPSSFGGYYLSMGDIIDSEKRFINFGSSGTNGHVGYSILTPGGLDGIERMQFSAENDETFLGINDYNESEIFKISRSSTGGLGTYIHLPKPDSRIVIGDFGSYLINDGHKFVVKDGSAMVEGNILPMVILELEQILSLTELTLIDFL